jgi:hypothetical protein
VFPFSDAFFIGMRAGYQHIAASTTVGIEGLCSAAVAAEVGTSFLNPRHDSIMRLGTARQVSLLAVRRA